MPGPYHATLDPATLRPCDLADRSTNCYNIRAYDRQRCYQDTIRYLCCTRGQKFVIDVTWPTLGPANDRRWPTTHADPSRLRLTGVLIQQRSAWLL